eukprot:Gb_34907 [translate_table: standard]
MLGSTEDKVIFKWTFETHPIEPSPLVQFHPDIELKLLSVLAVKLCIQKLCKVSEFWNTWGLLSTRKISLLEQPKSLCPRTKDFTDTITSISHEFTPNSTTIQQHHIDGMNFSVRIPSNPGLGITGEVSESNLGYKVATTKGAFLLKRNLPDYLKPRMKETITIIPKSCPKFENNVGLWKREEEAKKNPDINSRGNNMLLADLDAKCYGSMRKLKKPLRLEKGFKHII